MTFLLYSGMSGQIGLEEKVDCNNVDTTSLVSKIQRICNTASTFSVYWENSDHLNVECYYWLQNILVSLLFALTGNACNYYAIKSCNCYVIKFFFLFVAVGCCSIGKQCLRRFLLLSDYGIYGHAQKCWHKISHRLRSCWRLRWFWSQATYRWQKFQGKDLWKCEIIY